MPFESKGKSLGHASSNASDRKRDRTRTAAGPQMQLMQHAQRFALLNWEDVRCFTVLARNRTLVASPRALKTPPAEIQQRLANLEGVLGYALFARGAHGFELNANGAAALAEAAQMEMAACSLVQKRPGV